MIPGGPLYGFYIGMAYMEQKLTKFGPILVKFDEILSNFDVFWPFWIFVIHLFAGNGIFLKKKAPAGMRTRKK